MAGGQALLWKGNNCIGQRYEVRHHDVDVVVDHLLVQVHPPLHRGHPGERGEADTPGEGEESLCPGEGGGSHPGEKR